MICLPTGTGKSIVIGKLGEAILQALELAKTGYKRVLNLTHVKELVEQNSLKTEAIVGKNLVGVFCAGLRRKETDKPIIFGSVKSVCNGLNLFKPVDVILVDECHLIGPSQSAQYQKVIAYFKVLNPYLRVIGLTATPYRLGMGNMLEGDIFTDVVIDKTQREDFLWFIEQGYLSPLIPKAPQTTLDVDNVKMRLGDFAKGDLEKAVNIAAKTQAAVAEMCQFGFDRKSWLIFAAGVNHADNVVEELIRQGVSATVVHSKIKAKDRAQRISDYKAGKYRAMVNMGVLTTGFDHPPLDMIGMLRPTQSPGLWVQMLGRGTRPSPETGKQNCLVMDFAANTARIGPINDPIMPKPKKAGKGDGKGQAPVKLCPECDHYTHASKPSCDYCDYEFPKDVPFNEEASTDELIATDEPKVERFKVNVVSYAQNNGRVGKLPTLRVRYKTTTKSFYQFICLEHDKNSKAKEIANSWWYERTAIEPPQNIVSALAFTKSLRTPTHIHVITNREHPEIIQFEYENG